MSPRPFDEEEDLRKALEVRGRIHDCVEADCQIYPDGTRRRNPRPGEADAAPSIPLIPEEAQYAKDKQFSRPKLSAKYRRLWKKYRRRDWPEG